SLPVLLSLLSRVLFFFFCISSHRLHLHFFPTRRSSDLRRPVVDLLGLAHREDRPGAHHGDQAREGQRFALIVRHVERSAGPLGPDRKSTRLNPTHDQISYAVICLTKKIPSATSRILNRY